MRTDSLQEFVNIRRELVDERGRLQARLQQINEALGDLSALTSSTPSPSAGKVEEPAYGSKGRRRGRGRGRSGTGGQSMREHVLAVLEEGPKTKEEILDAVKRRGYKFSTGNPLNSLGVVLYGKNPKLNRVNGKFSLANGSTTSSSTPAPSSKQAYSGSRKRTMSSEARAKIAEAQRKRWAAQKK